MKILSEAAELNAVKTEQVVVQKKYAHLPKFIHKGHKLYEFNGVTGAVNPIPVIIFKDKNKVDKVHEIHENCLYALGMNAESAKKRLKKVNRWA